MAGYLVAAGNLASSVSSNLTNSLAVDALPKSVHPMYKLKIYNMKRTIEFSGYVPEDFSMAIASDWNSPFTDTSLLSKFGNTGENVDKALKFAGASSMHKLWSARVWAAPQYFSLDLPIMLNAESNTKREVVEPIIDLLSLAAPSESVGGMLVPPGPSPALAIGEKFGQIINDTINSATGGNGVTGQPDGIVSKLLEDGEAFAVEIGTFFRAYPMVITSVNANFDNLFEHGTGNPINADFNLTVESYFALTREDLLRWFKMPNRSRVKS